VGNKQKLEKERIPIPLHVYNIGLTTLVGILTLFARKLNDRAAWCLDFDTSKRIILQCIEKKARPKWHF
jgi:hypothetical protein